MNDEMNSIVIKKLNFEFIEVKYASHFFRMYRYIIYII